MNLSGQLTALDIVGRSRGEPHGHILEQCLVRTEPAAMQNEVEQDRSPART